MRFSVLEPREPREPFSKPVAERDTRTIIPLPTPPYSPLAPFAFPAPINGAVSERGNRSEKRRGS